MAMTLSSSLHFYLATKMMTLRLVLLVGCVICAFGLPISPDNAAMMQFIQPIVSACGRNPYGSGDVCTWAGIVLCNSESRITVITLPGNPCSKDVELNLQLIPGHIKDIEIHSVSQFAFTGEIAFAADTRVEKAILSGNLFRFIDLTKLPPKLIWLDVSTNKIFAPMNFVRLPPQLMFLYLYNNQFTGELDMSRLPQNLREFDVHGNQLTSAIIPAQYPDQLNLDMLDLSYNLLMLITFSGVLPFKVVMLGSNHLTFVPWSAFTSSVTYIGLSFNNLTEVDLRALPASLEFLDLSHNAIYSVQVAKGNPALRFLYLDHNNIPSIDLTSLPVGLVQLFLDFNRLTSVDLSALPENLQNIGGTACGVSFAGNDGLSSVNFSLYWPNAITIIDFSRKQFTSFNVAEVPRGVLTLLLSGNKISSVTVSTVGTLTLIDLSRNHLSSIDWHLLPSTLKVIDLNYNQLSEVDFSNLPPQLSDVGLGAGVLGSAGNPVQSAKLNGDLPDAFNIIDFSGNAELSSITFGGVNPNIVKINLANNKLTSVDCLTLPNFLEKLIVANNRLTSFAFDSLPKSLTTIDASDNQISSAVSFSATSQLRVINLMNNAISSLSYASIPDTVLELSLRNNKLSGPLNWVSRLIFIQSLDLSLNQYAEELTFDVFPSALISLMLAGNAFTGTVNLAAITDRFKNLSVLWLQYNRFSGPLDLKSIAPDMNFVASHNQFSGSVTLPFNANYIDISANQFTGPLVMSGTTINYLLVSGNKFSGTLDLTGFTDPIQLDLSNNNFSGAFSLAFTSQISGNKMINITGNPNLCGVAKAPVGCVSIAPPTNCKLQPISSLCAVVCPKCP
jgi:hypothetical protein